MARRARQVPDQPRQRRREAPRRALRDDRPGRDRQRQAGPDRRQLGLARPGDPDRADGRERHVRRAARRARRDDRGDARVGDALGRAGRGDRPAPRPDHPLGQGLAASATSSTSTGCLAAPLRLPAPPRPDRGGDGRQGHHRLDRRAGDPAQRGHRRHDPRLAHARSRAPRASARSRSPSRSSSRWACARSCRRCRPARAAAGRPRTFFQEMAQQIQAYLKDRMPEWRETHPGVEDLRVAVMGCVVNGPGESQARRHRDQPAGHVRGAGRAGLHRRPARPDAARRRPRRRVHRDPRGVRRPAVPGTGCCGGPGRGDRLVPRSPR